MIPQICHFVQHLILFAVFGRYNRFRNFVAQLLQQLILTAAHEEFHLRIISLTLVQNHAIQLTDNLRQPFYLRHRQIGRMPQRIMEAGIFTCMAGHSLLLYLYEQRVTVTVIEQLYNLLQITACCALVPQLLTAAAPEPGITCFQCFEQ